MEKEVRYEFILDSQCKIFKEIFICNKKWNKCINYKIINFRLWRGQLHNNPRDIGEEYTMENVKIKEIPGKNLNELLEVIKEALLKCKDTQFFISEALLKRLLQENKSSIIWEESVLNGFHYCDKEEKAFLLYVMDNDQMKTFQMHFVSNFLEYVHLTFFASKGILYQNYLRGIKIIVIINTD